MPLEGWLEILLPNEIENEIILPSLVTIEGQIVLNSYLVKHVKYRHVSIVWQGAMLTAVH